MKPARVFIAITIVGGSLAILLSFALLFVDALAIVNNIASLYEKEGVQGLRLLARCLCMALIIVNAVLGFIALRKGKSWVTLSMLSGFGALIIATLCFLFYEWYFALGLFVSCFLISLPQVLGLTKKRFFDAQGEEVTD